MTIDWPEWAQALFVVSLMAVGVIVQRWSDRIGRRIDRENADQRRS